jgi:hypothetical protein
MLRRPVARAATRGVVGTVATTAVVVGTATAVSGRVQRRQAGQAEQAAEADAYQQQSAAAAQAPAPPPPPLAAPAETDLVTQLTQLAALKDQGVLTEEEFAAQKAKILGA